MTRDAALPLRAETRSRRYLAPAIPFVVFLGAWQLLTHLAIFPASSFPSPLKVLSGLMHLATDQGLLGALGVTVYRVLLGGAIGLTIGLAFGALVAVSRRIAYAVEPVTSFFQSIGEVGWLPVLVLWLGFNERPIIAVIAYTVMFPVFFGTVAGISGLPKNLVDSVRTLGAGRLRLITEVMLPGALPAIITGFRTGMGFGWRTVILAELLVGGEGLGVLLFEGREFFRPDWIIAEMLVIGCAWMLLDARVLVPIERNTVERWGLVR